MRQMLVDTMSTWHIVLGGFWTYSVNILVFSSLKSYILTSFNVNLLMRGIFYKFL